MSSTKKRNDKQQKLFEEWVQKEKELQDSYPPLPDNTLSTRKIKESHDLFEKYKRLIREAGD